MPLGDDVRRLGGTWLGRARELVARVVDRGLHLPEAAKLLRGTPPPPSAKPPPPLATLTLAEIYAAQGYFAKAVRVLDEVLERTPGHDEARRLRERFAARASGHAARAEVAEATAPAAEREASASSTTQPADPRRSGRDAVSVLPTQTRTAFVCWELRPRRLAEARWGAKQGELVLRVLAVWAERGTTSRRLRDLVVDGLEGDAFVHELPPGSEVRVCLGWRSADGLVPFAVAPEVRMPRDEAWAAHAPARSQAVAAAR
jgi:hypothetical protein